MPASARERLVSSAIALLGEHGVAGTGVAELLDHSHVSRRSVYVNFPGGKTELLAEAARVAGDAITGVIAGVAAEGDPPSMIVAFARFWARTLEASDYTMGCPIVAATLGRSEGEGPAEAAATVFSGWIGVLESRLLADGVEPDLAQSLATTVIAGIEGAVVLCLASRTGDPLARVGTQLAALVRLQTEG